MSLRQNIAHMGNMLYLISFMASTLTTATLLQRPITGFGRDNLIQKATDIDIPHTKVHKVIVKEKDLNASVIFAREDLDRLKRLELNLGWSDINVKTGTPSHGMFIAFSPEEEAIHQGKDALVASKATIQLMNTFCYQNRITPQECLKLVSKFKFAKTPLQESCRRSKKYCSQEEILSKYRSIDGSCNHKVDGTQGKSFTGYKRFLHPDYLDGVHEPRRSVMKTGLPSARLISSALLEEEQHFSKKQTLAVMQWSQFIEHDLSQTVSMRMVHSGKKIECCDSTGTHLSPRYIHPFCSPISIPEDDTYYSRLSIDCMSYVRSMPATSSECTFGAVDQMNQATHYLDGSQIYGSTTVQSQILRSHVNGKLSFSSKHHRQYLPISKNPTEDCQLLSGNMSCFKSGDSRVNLHPQLTAMHTIWLREHNRVAQKLSQLNPSWDDEIIFQEARRIVIAEMQRITYKEWIPTILGRKYMRLIEKNHDFGEHVSPSVSNSFATAAARSLISLIDGKLKLYTEQRLVNDSLYLQNHFNKPDIVEHTGYFDALIRGLATQNSKIVDMDYVEDIRNKFFSNGKYGFDILSLDIQRGRDHGLPSYTHYRALCGLPPVKDFQSLTDVMSVKAIESLKNVYPHPYDIDLIVGGILEKPDGDSLTGPTFSCIIADQFLRTKYGDRYFYSNGNQPEPFSKSQLKAIEKVTLARIFCDNSDEVKNMQKNVFMPINIHTNPLSECKSEGIPKLNLNLWSSKREIYS